MSNTTQMDFWTEEKKKSFFYHLLVSPYLGKDYPVRKWSRWDDLPGSPIAYWFLTIFTGISKDKDIKFKSIYQVRSDVRDMRKSSFSVGLEFSCGQTPKSAPPDWPLPEIYASRASGAARLISDSTRPAFDSRQPPNLSLPMSTVCILLWIPSNWIPSHSPWTPLHFHTAINPLNFSLLIDVVAFALLLSVNQVEVFVSQCIWGIASWLSLASNNRSLHLPLPTSLPANVFNPCGCLMPLF